MPTLRISIFGISCLADRRLNAQGNPIDTFQKRVLLPTDTFADATHPPHIPFVEIAELDLYNQPGTIPGLSERYIRNGVAYRRFELYGHRLWIENVDTTQGWSVSPVYDCRVAKMKQVLPTLDDRPDSACYRSDPPAELVSGYFDITYGSLGVGAIDAAYTSFAPTPPNTWPRRRLAIASVLDLEVTGTYPSFRIDPVTATPGSGTLVRLQTDTVGISMGNLPLSDLTGQPSTDDPPHDFQMFYNLATTYPVDPPLPTRPGGLDIACSNTNWP